MPDMHCWDVEVRFSGEDLARVLRAVIECGGQVVHTFLQEHGGPEHIWPLQLRVKLPAGTEDAFRQVSGCEVEESPEVAGSSGGAA